MPGRRRIAVAGPHPDLGRAVGAVEQAQRGRFQPQPVQQLAQRLALAEEAPQERQAELVGEGVDRLPLGGDRPGEAEAVQHVQERPARPGLGRLAGVEERQHPLGPLAVVEAPQQVPQVARGDPLVAQHAGTRASRAPASRAAGDSPPPAPPPARPSSRPPSGPPRPGTRPAAAFCSSLRPSWTVGSTTTTTRGSLQIGSPLQGLDPPPAGQVVADRPERPPALDPLPLLERGLVLGGPLVVDQVPRHGEERRRVGRPLLDDDLQADQPRLLPQVLQPAADLPGRLVLARQEVVEQPEAGLRQLERRLPGRRAVPAWLRAKTSRLQGDPRSGRPPGAARSVASRRRCRA